MRKESSAIVLSYKARKATIYKNGVFAPNISSLPIKWRAASDFLRQRQSNTLSLRRCFVLFAVAPTQLTEKPTIEKIAVCIKGRKMQECDQKHLRKQPSILCLRSGGAESANYHVRHEHFASMSFPFVALFFLTQVND